VANIQLKITALGDFSSVNNQLKALQTQVTSLQKSIAGVGLNANLSTQLKNIQTEFGNALVSSGNFTKQTVQLTSETEKFGQALQKGQLSLGQYFGIITGKSASARASVNALAQEQVKLNNSIVQQDITKQGVYSVFTPTTIDPIAKSVEIAAAKQNIFNLAIKNGSQELINFGKNTQWAGRQLTVGLSMPAILFGSQAVAAFKAVNTELTRLQRLYGEGLTPPSQAQLNAISNQVINLGKQVAQQMGIAQSATVQVAANFAAMGIQGQKLLDVTYQAQRLSKLGAIDATQATNAIVSLQNVYKVSSTDLGNAVNFLSSMQKQTTMSLQDMTDAIPRVGPIMAQLGGGYKDTAVMLLAMREAGIPAAQAANALKSAFASIIAPTAAANKEFASFGINLTNIKNAGTPTQMLMALQSALAPLNKMAQEQLIEKLFGKFQFARISALLDNFGKVGSQTQNALKVAGATNSQLATLAGQEMAQATQSTTAKWQRAIETLKADLYPIGQKILEVGTKLIDFGQKIADFFNKLPGPIKNGLGILLTLGVLSGPIIMITGLLANLMGQGMKVGYAILGMIDGTRKWKDLMTPAGVAAKVAMDAMNTGVLENVSAVDTLNAALQRLITSLEALNMNFQVGTDTSLLGRVEAAAAGEAAAGTLLLPGMATGGYVPGTGNTDTYPAMLTPGEAVIPKAAAAQHAPLVTALISGNLPKYAYGLDPEGNKVRVERGHVYSSHNQDILNKARATLSGQSRLSSMTSAESGVMMGMTNPLNQTVRGTGAGMSGAGVASELETFRSLTGSNGQPLDPMSMIKANAQRLGADMDKANKLLDQAYEDLIAAAKNQTTTVFGKGKGQVPLEKWMQKQLKPTLQKIETSVGGNLDNALSRVVGPRGNQKLENGKTKNASGATLYIDEKGNLVPLNQSGTGLVHGEVSTYGGSMPGAISSSKAPVALTNQVKTMAKTEIGASIAEQTINGVDEGLNGSTGTSKIQGIFSKAFGANSRLSGMMSKFSGMGMMGRMGVGMGITTAAQMASPLLNKLPGGNLITDAMSGAGMGAGFGPWGMAAGAAISLVTGGIKSLMAAEKQHAAESKADFSSATDAVQFMGGKVVDVTTKVHDFTFLMNNPTSGVPAAKNNFEQLAKGIQYTSSQLSSFNNMVKSLPKDNPLALVIEQVKNAGSDGSAAKLAKEFVDMQVALGEINQSQATQLEQLILTVGGKNATSAKPPAASQVDAIKASIVAALPDMQQFAQVLGQLTNLAINTSSYQEFQSIIAGLGSTAATSTQQLEALAQFYGNNPQVLKLIQMMQSSGKGFTASDVAAVLKALSNHQNVTFDSLQPGKVAEQYADQTKNLSPAAQKISDQIKAKQKQLDSLTSGGTATLAANTAAVKNNVDGLTKQQKVLDANLKSLQDLQKQQTQNTNYATTKEDIKNQILMAQATGDNLKAQLLQQQLLGTTKDFNLQTNIDVAQQKADANRLALDEANAAVSKAQTTATQNATTATDKLTKEIKDLQAQLAGMPGGSLITTPASGATTPAALGANAAAVNQGKGNPLLPSPAAKGFKVIYHPLAKHNQQQSGRLSTDYTDPKTGYTYEAATGKVTNKDGNVIGQWATWNADNVLTAFASGGSVRGAGSATSDSIPAMLSNGEYVINAGAVQHYGKGTFDALNARHLAKGGVARTNSSITYHKQHMNRISRHFAGGGFVNPIDSVIGMISGIFDSKASGIGQGISKEGLETAGVSPALRLLQGKKQSNWDYLGVASMLAGPAKGLGLIPKTLGPLAALLEGADLTQNTFEAAGNAKQSLAGSNHVYNVNVNVARVDSTVDMEKAISDAMAKIDAKAKMSGRVSVVGR